MDMLRVANANISASRIAFGTSGLHHVAAPERERLLLTALENGVTHFDTSPYYGFGVAERALATLATKAVTVATKVGLYPPGGADSSESIVLARKVVGRFVPRLSRPIASLNVAHARASLLGSLRRMRRDRVDLLFLHEPRYDLLSCDEWLRWLDSERDRIGAVGVAGEPQHLLPFVMASSPMAGVVQARDSLRSEEAAPLREAGHAPQITFGHLANRDPALSVTQVLCRAMERFPSTILLVSTRRPEHIREWTRCVETGSKAESVLKPG